MAGAVQATGWPGVVTAVANWFGKSKKGLIFGVWNSHTSIGNILGSVIAGMFTIKVFWVFNITFSVTSMAEFCGRESNFSKRISKRKIGC